MTTMKPVIQKGDVVCLADLLFTRNRDSLVKNNNQQVKAEQLAGKVVVIFFVPLYGFSDSLTWCTELLKEIYHDSRLNNTFEVVFVAFLGGRAPFDGNKLCHLQPPECFHDIFSSMPWTAIPFSDIASRESLQRRFGVPDTTFIPKIFVIDSTGRVVQDNWLFIDHYGASGYPYSDERINFLKGEDEAVAEQPSLKALLTSPQRDYVISNQGQKVPIHILEDKEVILYFYREGRTDDRLTEQLKTAYEKSAVEQDFEIVLIYSDPLMISNEETFRKKFKTMPWLAIPFRDPNIRKLDRIFEYPNIEKLKQFFNHCSDPHLSDPPEVVIFGHHGEFFEPFGKEILLQYGTKASPFTRKVAAKLETEKVKELTLEMLCFIYTVFRRKDGSEVPFSELAGKRVILFYEKSGENCPRDGDCQCQIVGFLKMLKEKYLQMKGTDEEFEVIHIVDKNEGGNPNLFMRRNGFKTESFASVHIRDFPWLVSLKNNQLPASFGTYIYLDGDVRFLFPLLENPCLILAFDQDARLVRRTFYPTLEDTNFPFKIAQFPFFRSIEL
nr:PREDICTED: probable nucleoredoxin 1 isoform X2 [Daucus carota subsp. sativus]